MENAVTNVKGRKELEDVNITKDRSLKRLDNIFGRLHVALDKRKEQLSEELTHDSMEKKNRLQEQEDELCLLLERLKSCSSFFNDITQKGASQDVLTMKGSMLKRKDELTAATSTPKLQPVVQNSLPIDWKLKRMEDKVLQLIPHLEVITPLRDYTQIGEQNHQLVTEYEGKQFQCLHSITIGTKVILSHNSEVIIFDKDLQLIRTFGQGSGDCKLNYPIGLAVSGNVIAVSDWEDHVVKKFSLQGDFLSKFGSYIWKQRWSTLPSTRIMF